MYAEADAAKIIGPLAGAVAAEASTSGCHATTETAEKLDALMELVFKHLEHRCEQGQLSGAWTTLLHTFGQSILDTHRSKFTQYLLWYLCRQASCSAAFDGRSDCGTPSFFD